MHFELKSSQSINPPRAENGLLEAQCGLVFEKVVWRDDSDGKKCKGQKRKAIQIKDV